MTAMGEPDMPPLNITGAIADQMGGIMLAYGILAALLAREKYQVGRGGHLAPWQHDRAPTS